MLEAEVARSSDKRVKSNKEQLLNAAKDILYKATACESVTALKVSPCLLSTASVDGRGRAQRAMRVNGRRFNFRPWHITWIAENGAAPEQLQYSHRCHNENCVEPSHGLWETDLENKARWSCRVCSHLILPNKKCLALCTHKPCCYRPKVVETWADECIVKLPPDS